MSKTLSLLLAVVICLPTYGFNIWGEWTSDCQNYSSPEEGYASIKPVDTFKMDGTASLRVHVYEKKDCLGKEWDAEILSCTYELGKEIAILQNTRELDLICNYHGEQHWFEIVERLPHTIRFGNKTGMTPLERPSTLGGVYYRK